MISIQFTLVMVVISRVSHIEVPPKLEHLGNRLKLSETNNPCSFFSKKFLQIIYCQEQVFHNNFTFKTYPLYHWDKVRSVFDFRFRSSLHPTFAKKTVISQTIHLCHFHLIILIQNTLLLYVKQQNYMFYFNVIGIGQPCCIPQISYTLIQKI